MTTTHPPNGARTPLDIWLLPPPDSPRDIPATELNAYERHRAESYRRTDDRQMYLAAHVGLRRVLAVYTGIDPEHLRLGGERYDGNGARQGRPRVLGVPGAPQFSLSHSHGLALVVVSEDRVGADVQRLPSPQTVAAVLPSLHPAEQIELESLPPAEQPAAFGRLWVRKEAYLKGLGTGLARGADADYLGEAGLAARPAGWVVGNLPLCLSHVAAVALRGDGDRAIVMRSVPPEYLYAAHGAVRLIAGMPPGLRTVLRAAPSQDRAVAP
ncbi:4'-phosphopantetheinyl transferase superfamily protein [Streptomyces sp. TLI_171]|uniref:4'-phosphopantetheinyl transferase family protein n=1 Tax=Streptomyces sp. TLI_171 TaxID=1938859 RepID=UPI000C18D3EE|nr:4'-phosphopantetheinyl transferase superfamily protein [Streptomyces sp. TLI_171]RKE19888.1 4'-phosphopantetheinyl transferase [Streptomyces sp. TLI_171]